MKKRRQDKNNLQLNNEMKFNLTLPCSSDITSNQVLLLYKQLTELSNLEQKASVIEKISLNIPEFGDGDADSFTRLLLQSLLQHSSKDLLRRHLAKSLQLLSQYHPEIYWNSIQEHLNCKLISDIDAKAYHNIQTVVMELKENSDSTCEAYIIFKERGFVDLWKASIKHIESLWNDAVTIQNDSSELNSRLQLLNLIIRNLNSLVQSNEGCIKNCVDSDNELLFSKLLHITTSSLTSLDLRSSCGLLCVLLVIKIEEDLQFVLSSIIYKTGRFQEVNDASYLALFHGILCLVDGTILFNFNKDNCNFDDWDTKMLDKTLILINSSQISSIAVLGSRILKSLIMKLLEECTVNESGSLLISSLFRKYSIYSDSTKRILDSLWVLLDHFLDCVKHVSRDTFALFLQVQFRLNHEEALKYFVKFSKSLCLSLSKRQSLVALNCLIPFIGSKSLVKTNTELVISLSQMLSDFSFANYASYLIETLFTKHFSEVDYEDWYDFWFPQLFLNFKKDMLVYGYENLLKTFINILKDTTRPLKTLSSLVPICDQNLCVLIISTKICLKSPTYAHVNSGGKLWKDILPFHFLSRSLESGDETLAILAFNLICESLKSTELFNEKELEAVLAFTETNIVCQDPAFRQKYLSNMKKVLNRIQKGIASKTKTFASIEDKSELEVIRATYENFLIKLFKFLLSSLSHGSNFQRRSTSLVLMELIFNLVDSETHFRYLRKEITSGSVKDTLIICLDDSYDCNREIALKLCSQFSKDRLKQSSNFTHKWLEDVWNFASSTRPQDTLTASYILRSIIIDSEIIPEIEHELPIPVSENRKLIFGWIVFSRLQKEVFVCQESLFKAASSGPMYGLLLCLRTIFSTISEKDLMDNEHLWSDIIKKSVSLCLKIADLVCDIVKNSSPEGHLPMDLNFESCRTLLEESIKGSIGAQENGLITHEESLSAEEVVKAQAVSSQMLLLCGWRCIKEISLFFGFLIHSPKSGPNTLDLLSLEHIQIIGNFFINQLMETKHRGAFEQSYTGFKMICEKLSQCQNNSMASLPEKWLDDTLQAIQDQNETRLCATRRSAGVPFIVQAIVSSEPSSKSDSSLKKTLDVLVNVAKSEQVLESRVHAMNILRSLYKDSKIGEAIIPYAAEGMKVAVEGYISNTWSMRNSSSLLFSALMTRMLGVKKTRDDLHAKNSMSALVFFKRYPNLYEFFLDNLKCRLKTMKEGQLSPSAFPVLLLLARLSPASSDGFSTSVPLDPFVPLVMEFSSSPIYHHRCLASKALVSLVTPLTLTDVIKQLCSNLSLHNQNKMQGSLFCVTQILKTFSDFILRSRETLDKVNQVLTSVTWVAREANSCYMTRGTALEMFTLMLHEGLFISPLPLKPLSASCFSMLLSLNEKYSHIPGGNMAIKASVSFLVTINFKYQKSIIEPLLKLLDFPSPEIRSSILHHIYTSKTYTSPTVIQKIISSIKSKETNYECNQLLFKIFTKIVNAHLNYENVQDYERNLDEVLVVILVKFNFKLKDELISSLVECSGAIISCKLKFKCEIREQMFVKWVEAMSRYSDIDYPEAVRNAAAAKSSEVLSLLHTNPKLKDQAEIPLIRIMLELLVDDDASIRVVVGQHAHLFLLAAVANSTSFQECSDIQTTKPASVILRQLLLYLASSGADSFLTLLIGFALEEDLPEEFGLTSEEDRVFEKSETKLYREEIQISKYVSESITQIQLLKGVDFYQKIQFNPNDIANHFLLPLPVSGATQNELSLADFVHVLKRDIEYILDQFQELREKTPLGMKRFDLWLKRLARRALVWNSFKVYCDQIIDESLTKILKESLLKPAIFNDILQWLG